MAAAPSPQIYDRTAPRSAVRRWLSRAVALVYGLVMFEVASCSVRLPSTFTPPTLLP